MAFTIIKGKGEICINTDYISSVYKKSYFEIIIILNDGSWWTIYPEPDSRREAAIKNKRDEFYNKFISDLAYNHVSPVYQTDFKFVNEHYGSERFPVTVRTEGEIGVIIYPGATINVCRT